MIVFRTQHIHNFLRSIFCTSVIIYTLWHQEFTRSVWVFSLFPHHFLYHNIYDMVNEIIALIFWNTVNSIEYLHARNLRFRKVVELIMF